MRPQWTGLLLAVVLGVTGCAGNEGAQDSTHGATPLYRDLALGDVGEDVRTVNGYLTKYGYFPNEQLAHDYPAWRPAVTERPLRMEVFDERTQDAVGHLQRIMGLPVTGLVDETTRELLGRSRCSFPDGIQSIDESAKYALTGSKWPTHSISWVLLNSDDGIPFAAAKQEIAAALSTWARYADLTFSYSIFAPDITIKFASIDGGGNVLAQAAQPSQGGDLTIDTSELWSASGSTPGGFDLQTLALHELGHSLGLNHSSNEAATMYPIFPDHKRQSLISDDMVAISALYDSPVEIAGNAKDIAVGADGSTWIVGGAAITGGFQVMKRNAASGGWDVDASNVGAVRIGVQPNGIPWSVDSGSRIRRRTSSDPFSGSWELMNGYAYDLGINGDGTAVVWFVGITPTDGGFRVLKFNPVTLQTDVDPTLKGAVRVTVDRGGRPWFVDSNGNVFERSSAELSSPGWTLHPSPGTGAVDIGIAEAGRHPWIIRRASSFTGRVSVRNVQAALGSAPAVDEWNDVFNFFGAGPNMAIAVGPNSRPFFVHNAGAIKAAKN